MLHDDITVRAGEKLFATKQSSCRRQAIALTQNSEINGYTSLGHQFIVNRYQHNRGNEEYKTRNSEPSIDHMKVTWSSSG